jgi:hypothetical protein
VSLFVQIFSFLLLFYFQVCFQHLLITVMSREISHSLFPRMCCDPMTHSGNSERPGKIRPCDSFPYLSLRALFLYSHLHLLFLDDFTLISSNLRSGTCSFLLFLIFCSHATCGAVPFWFIWLLQLTLASCLVVFVVTHLFCCLFCGSSFTVYRWGKSLFSLPHSTLLLASPSTSSSCALLSTTCTLHCGISLPSIAEIPFVANPEDQRCGSLVVCPSLQSKFSLWFALACEWQARLHLIYFVTRFRSWLYQHARACSMVYVGTCPVYCPTTSAPTSTPWVSTSLHSLPVDLAAFWVVGSSNSFICWVHVRIWCQFEL